MDDTLQIKSDAWQKIGAITGFENNVVIGFGACKQCHNMLTFHSYKIGTSCHP